MELSKKYSKRQREKLLESPGHSDNKEQKKIFEHFKNQSTMRHINSA